MNSARDDHRGHHHADMISVEDAYSRILGAFQILESEERGLLKSQGQVMAQDIFSPFDIPMLSNSAMDGYAIRYRDVQSASSSCPVILKVTETVAAGYMPKGTVVKGTAIRIMTGAPVPEGCDTIIPFEETDEEERKTYGKGLNEIGIKKAQTINMHIRPRGEDIPKYSKVLAKGTTLTPSYIGILASLGFKSVKVTRRPRVAIIATGDELISPGRQLKEGKIFDSNSYTIGAAVERYGGIPKIIGIAKDNMEHLRKKLLRGLDSDLIVTCAGVSKGDYDMVKDVLAELGEVNFWSIRMRPAKPLAWGILKGGRRGGSTPHIGLPGNPVSALVAFEEFVRPAILKMLGRKKLSKPTILAELEAPIYNYDGRRVYARVNVTLVQGKYYAKPTGPQGSNILTSMARANGLAICPEDRSFLDKGQEVVVKMLEWNEEGKLD